MGQCCSMAPLKEGDIVKVQSLVRKWSAKRKLALLKQEYLQKLSRKFFSIAQQHVLTSPSNPDIKMPAPQGMDSGPPLFSDAQMQ